MLELGNFIPDFTAPDQDGNIVSSAELLGKKTVVYFYPKASTPGCTAEACSLRDNYDRFLAAGYNVVGISRDSVKAQKNCISVHSYIPTWKITTCPLSEKSLSLTRNSSQPET